MEEALGVENLSLLAESADVFCLTLNLIQKCGLEKVMEAAVVPEREDNMRKQHDTIAQLSQTKAAYARPRRRDGKCMARAALFLKQLPLLLPVPPLRRPAIVYSGALLCRAAAVAQDTHTAPKQQRVVFSEPFP